MPCAFPPPANEKLCVWRIVYFLNFEATLNLPHSERILSPIYALNLLEMFFLFLQIGLECNLDVELESI